MVKNCPHCGIPDETKWSTNCKWLSFHDLPPCAKKSIKRSDRELKTIFLGLVAIYVVIYFTVRAFL